MACHSRYRDAPDAANNPARVLEPACRMEHERSSRSNARARRERVPGRSTVATHRALFDEANERRCDLCGAQLAEGVEDGGSGLYVWTRGDEVRFEEPPLCETCGPELALAASRRFLEEEEEEG